jgi:small-conductance mechanosensitive channel
MSDQEMIDTSVVDAEEFARNIATVTDEQLREGMRGPMRGPALDEVFNRMEQHFRPEAARDTNAVIHFRIGGRVEDVGVRLTTLRAPAGDRIIVPNTVVFSSAIENNTVGTMDRQRYVVSGIALPIGEIQSAVVESLRGTPHLSHRAPIVTFVQATPDGTNIQVTVEHDLGQRVDESVIAKLRALFPEATIATPIAASVS